MESEVDISGVIPWIVLGAVVLVCIILGVLALKRFFKRAELYGMSREEILAEYPDLEPEDITEALQYAAWLAKEEVREVHQG